MATVDFISDDFQSGPSDGSSLDGTTDWETDTRSGSGVPTGDNHSDHHGATVVIDMSTTGDARCVWVTDTLSSDDQHVQITAFCDQLNGSGTKYGVLLRLADANPTTVTGYGVNLEVSATDAFNCVINEINAGSDTELSTTAVPLDVASQSLGCAVLEASIVGDIITAVVNGSEVASYDVSGDASPIDSGGYVGVECTRGDGDSDDQPFFVYFQAWIDGLT